MPEGVEHNWAKYAKGFAYVVRLASMPEGVEHVFAWVAQQERARLVRLASMPEGVEH